MEVLHIRTCCHEIDTGPEPVASWPEPCVVCLIGQEVVGSTLPQVFLVTLWEEPQLCPSAWKHY